MPYEYDPKDMQFRNLGPSGLQVPVLSLGFWLTVGKTVKGDLSKEIIKTAFEAGINMFDTAEGYADGESERELGRVLKELGYRRTDLIISTKIFFGVGRKGPNDKGLSRKHLIEGLNESLERLQMDYVDIVFAHRPDPNVPMLEVVRAFDWLVNQGKALYWSTSEWSAIQIEEAFHIADKHNLIGPISDQCEYNGFKRQRLEVEYQHVFDRYKYGTTIFSPLAGGLLSGKYNDGIPADSRLATTATDPWIKRLAAEMSNPWGKIRIEAAQKLGKIAKEEFDCTTAQLALAWAVRNTKVSTVILGATSSKQVLENLKALEIAGKITDEQYIRMNEIFDEVNNSNIPFQS
ncbi:hypothetical protein FRC02_011361 [Tulasnella sp. 418]|nr:hypothetical protein FRC02_011361 [Tulasnella sp. 418]